MLAGRYDLTIEQGATFALSMFYQDDAGAAVDLMGYTARMQLRETVDAATAVLDLTTENGRILIDAERGQVTLSIAATDTANLTGTGVYDLELVQGVTVLRILEGTYKVNPGVTR